MKNLSYALIFCAFALIACKKYNGTKDCSALPPSVDTLSLSNIQIFAKAHGSKINTYSIVVEVVPKNDTSKLDHINVNLMQFHKGNKCWEVNNLIKMSAQDGIVYLAEDIPKWAIDTKTKVYAKLKEGSNEYVLVDNALNQ